MIDYSKGFIYISITTWIFFFLLFEMVFPPIQIGKETKKKKYLRLAQQELEGCYPFTIRPLTELQQECLIKRFDNWKLAHFLELAAVWILTLFIDISMKPGIKISCYLITIPEIIFSFFWIRYTLSRYQRVIDEIDLFGKLEAKIILKYTKRQHLPNTARHVSFHYAVSAYVDDNDVIHCFDSRHEIPSNESGDFIDCLMYNGQFAGYGIGEYPISRAPR